MLQIAIAIDQNGNTVCGKLFDLTLIKKDGFKFGSPDFTISYVIGKNKQINTLTYLGSSLYLFLNSIQKNHCEISVEFEEAKFKNC